MSRPDTSIYQTAGQWPSPLQRRQQEIQLSDIQAQAEERRLNAEKLRQQNEEARAKYNEAQAVRNVVTAKAQAGQEVTAQDILSAAPINGHTWAEAYIKNQSAQIANQKSVIENAKQQHALIASHLGALKSLPVEQRQAIHDDWVKQNASWLGNQAESLRNDGLTDSELDFASKQALTVEQQLEEAHKATTEAEQKTLREAQTLQANAAAKHSEAEARKANAEAAQLESGVPKTQTDTDKELAAFLKQRETNSALKKYTPDLLGLRQYNDDEGIRKSQAIADAAEARREAAAAKKEGPPDPRLANVPQNQHKDVLDKYQKTKDVFNTAMKGQDEINTVIQQARSGNKEAQAYAPVMAAQVINELNDTKRLNQAEVSRYGNAGSLIDRLMGKLGSLTQGKPIPNDILNDMQALHDALGANSKKAYARGVQSINETYRANLPVEGETVSPSGNKRVKFGALPER